MSITIHMFFEILCKGCAACAHSDLTCRLRLIKYENLLVLTDVFLLFSQE